LGSRSQSPPSLPFPSIFFPYSYRALTPFFPLPQGPCNLSPEFTAANATPSARSRSSRKRKKSTRTSPRPPRTAARCSPLRRPRRPSEPPPRPPHRRSHRRRPRHRCAPRENNLGRTIDLDPTARIADPREGVDQSDAATSLGIFLEYSCPVSIFVLKLRFYVNLRKFIS
jgi:hypothetical protein